jgi:flagellar biosynthesis/type III secretory pathway protein FliH
MDGNRVLKAGQAALPWPRRRLSAAEWMGAERAAALVAGAEAEVEAVRRAAGEVRAAAREEGRAEGRREAGHELAARLSELDEAQRRWLARTEVEVLDLAMEMAKRILGRELRGDPAAASEGLADALRAAGPRRALRVRLHPAGVAGLRDRPSSPGEGSTGAGLELVADPDLAPGDVVVETEAGQVDGRVASRLEAFRAALGVEAP